jgi:hypothetical protein
MRVEDLKTLRVVVVLVTVVLLMGRCTLCLVFEQRLTMAISYGGSIYTTTAAVMLSLQMV